MNKNNVIFQKAEKIGATLKTAYETPVSVSDIIGGVGNVGSKIAHTSLADIGNGVKNVAVNLKSRVSAVFATPEQKAAQQLADMTPAQQVNHLRSLANIIESGLQK